MKKKQTNPRRDNVNLVPAKGEDILNNGQWAPINLSTLSLLGEYKLNATDIIVYQSLAALSNSTDGYAFPNRKKLAKIVHRSVEYVDNSLRNLVDANLIKKIPHWNEDGGQTSNRYEVFAVLDDFRNILGKSGEKKVAEITPTPPGDNTPPPSSENSSSTPGKVIPSPLIEDVIEDVIEERLDSVESFSFDKPKDIMKCKGITNHAHQDCSDEVSTKDVLTDTSLFNIDNFEPSRHIRLDLAEPDTDKLLDGLITKHFNQIPDYPEMMSSAEYDYWRSLNKIDRFLVLDVFYTIYLANKHILNLELGNYGMTIRDIDNCKAIVHLHREWMPNLVKVILSIGMHYNRSCFDEYPLTPGETLKLMKDYADYCR